MEHLAIEMVAKAAVVIMALFATGWQAEGVTPVQKVVQLLTGMVEKGKKEKHDEQVQFAAYKQFCDDTSTEKTRAIAEANERIEKLTADIQMFNEEAAKLAKEIAAHEDDIATWTGDEKASSSVRKIENGDYLTLHKDYAESITALKNGIKTVQGVNKNVAQAASFAQISASQLIPAETKQAMDSFLAQGSKDLGDLFLQEEQPATAAYSSHSQGLVDMLEKLVDKFKDEQSDLEKQEKSAVQAYELLAQDLKSYIGTASKASIEKSGAKAKALESSADASSDLQETTNTRDDDAKYLADLTAECQAKSASFEERQKLRGEEIEAVEKAIEILSSGAVAGASEKHLPQLLQSGAASFAQLRNEARNPSQMQVAAYLLDQGTRINSRILKAIATRVTEDPFKKVTKMIKDLIVKLMEEANGESEQKGWCDDELATNEQTRKAKTEEVETLHAEIDQLEASVSKLAEEIQELTQGVADIDAAVAKATEIREAEKAKNAITIADAKEAQTAVASALAVLKEFYAKAGEATAFVQAPEIFDEPYKGMGGESGGVVGMIEVIASDFARLESETSAAESEAAEEYSTFTKDSATDKEQKQSDIDSKSSKKTSDEQTLAETKSGLAGTQKELDAGLQYYEKLRPQCIDTGVSYDDRVARRKEEIASLQEALSILEGQ